MNDYHQTPNKEDTKPAPKPENQENPLSPEHNRKRLWKQEHETDQINKIFTTFTKNTHAMEIPAMK
jgi:hypothetical protein